MKNKLLALVLVCMIGLNGCSWWGGEQKNSEQQFGEYGEGLAQFMVDYRDALIGLNVVALVDPAETKYEVWQSRVEENIGQWQDLQKESEPLLSFLDEVNVSYSTGLIDRARAQEGIMKEELFTEYGRYMEAVNQAPTDKQLAAFIQKSGITDARIALETLQELRQIEAKEWLDTAASKDRIANSFKMVRNGSFTAVAIGALVVSGGAVVTATSIVAKGAGIVTTSIAGADMALQVGENTATVIDNTQMKTYFSQGRENLKYPVLLANVVGMRDLNDPNNWCTAYEWGEKVRAWYENTEDPKQVLNFYVPEDQRLPVQINFSASKDDYLKMVNNMDPFSDVLGKYFPPGGYVIDGQSFIIESGGVVYRIDTPLMDASGTESGETKSNFAGEYPVDPIVFVFPGTSITDTTTGTIVVNSEGGASAQLMIVTSGGGDISVSGTGAGNLAGGYDSKQNVLSMTGNYSLSNLTSTGYSELITGTITLDGRLVEDRFEGSANFTASYGGPTSTGFVARRK